MLFCTVQSSEIMHHLLLLLQLGFHGEKYNEEIAASKGTENALKLSMKAGSGSQLYNGVMALQTFDCCSCITSL